mgnify:CR=1 FL=1
MIADGDKEKAKKNQEEYVHRLGNLTLTGYNSELGNRTFIEKRDLTNKNGDNVGYKNGLSLNDDVKNNETWTVNNIIDRTNSLVEKIMELMKF